MHIASVVTSVSDIISTPKDYTITIIIYVTFVCGMLCSLFVHKTRIPGLVILGISFVALVIKDIMEIKTVFSQINNLALSPIEGIMFYVVRSVILLVSIVLFSYQIFRVSKLQRLRTGEK